MDCKIYASLVTVGNGVFGTSFVLYALAGGMAVLLRLLLGQSRRDLRSVLKDDCELDQSQVDPDVILTFPRVRVFLLFPVYHLTSTTISLATYDGNVRVRCHCGRHSRL